MRIHKSTRHQKIVGNFGEHLVCNWLSRSGFEVSIVDHTGIDIIASNPKLIRRLGISVKSRTRLRGKEADSVTVFQKAEDRKKLLAACKAFACKPWIAIYVESETHADLFLTDLKNYQKKYRSGKSVQRWQMTENAESKYAADTKVKRIHIEFKDINWWQA